MRVKFLGTDSHNGGSPTLFRTDRGTLVARGYVITDPEALADLGEVPTGEADIEFPAEMLRFAEHPMNYDPRPGHGDEEAR
jgi:hypothetical protein